ncbi:YwqG family protein [Paenibacillus sp. S-38]|uniref:YwqG family protein n=1 Tax=Paenibacillus sp. S-38 TaxID=3416710 RepID=UPI003CF4290E
MNREEIVKLLEDSGLEAYREAIASWIFPSHQLHLQPEQEELLPLGSSKMGGHPDLPSDVEWPMWKHYHQSFLAQINLADVTTPPHSLPSGGLLSFFYAVEAMLEDSEFYGDRHTCRVIYTPAEQLGELARRPSPDELREEFVLKPNRVGFVPTLCVPPQESAFLESLGLGWNSSRKEFDKYRRAFLKGFNKHQSAGNCIHRFLGHADPIQGDMQFSCEMNTQGLSWEDIRESEAVRQRVQQSALGWLLLLQIDSEEEKTGMMWGDTGRVYFWIKEEDLSAQRFDRAVCEMQCC